MNVKQRRHVYILAARLIEAVKDRPGAGSYGSCLAIRDAYLHLLWDSLMPDTPKPVGGMPLSVVPRGWQYEGTLYSSDIDLQRLLTEFEATYRICKRQNGKTYWLAEVGYSGRIAALRALGSGHPERVASEVQWIRRAYGG